MPRLVNGLEQIFTNLGIVGSGYKLFFFEYNTTTPKTTYSDQDLTVPNPNPVECDSTGRPETDIWGLDPAQYKCVLGTPDSVIGNINPIVTLDPIDDLNVGSIVVFDPIPAAYWGTTNGTSTVYTLASLVPITSYDDKQCFFVDFNTASGSSPTLNINSLGALDLKKYTNEGTKIDIESGDLQAQRYVAINDGVDIVILNPQKPQATSSARGSTLLPSKPTISNGTDTEHDINFGAYTMQFSDGSGQAVQTAKTKQADTTWVAGTNAGGMASGVSLANNTSYYMFALSNSTGSIVDFGFDSSKTATNLIADSAVTTHFGGTPKWQYIAGFRTDGSANIRNGSYFFSDKSYFFEYDQRVQSYQGTSVATPTLRTLDVPNGDVVATLAINHSLPSGTGIFGSLYSSASLAANATNCNISGYYIGGSITNWGSSVVVATNGSSQVYESLHFASTITNTTTINTLGWIEYL